MRRCAQLGPSQSTRIASLPGGNLLGFCMNQGAWRIPHFRLICRARQAAHSSPLFFQQHGGPNHVSQHPYCKYVLQPRHAINPEKCQKLSIATSDVVFAGTHIQRGWPVHWTVPVIRLKSLCDVSRSPRLGEVSHSDDVDVTVSTLRRSNTPRFCVRRRFRCRFCTEILHESVFQRVTIGLYTWH